MTRHSRPLKVKALPQDVSCVPLGAVLVLACEPTVGFLPEAGGIGPSLCSTKHHQQTPSGTEGEEDGKLLSYPSETTPSHLFSTPTLPEENLGGTLFSFCLADMTVSMTYMMGAQGNNELFGRKEAKQREQQQKKKPVNNEWTAPIIFYPCKIAKQKRTW